MRHNSNYLGRHRDSPHQGEQRRPSSANEISRSHQHLASSRVIEPLTTSAVDPHRMDTTRRTQLIRQRAVAKSALTRMQTFIETGDRKVNDIQVRFDELPNICNKFETAQSELELSDDTDYSVDRQQLEDQYFEVKAKFNEFLHPVMDAPSRRSSPRSSLSGHSNHTARSHTSSTHIKLPTIALPNFEGDTYSWLHYRDTFVALFVKNTNVSNVQKFHYLIASLKNGAKHLISNLHITNENFLLAWQLVKMRYNNKR